MPRISINEISTYHWSLLEDVTGYRAAGVNGIGVWRRKLSDFGEERGVELLRESELAVSSFWSAGGFTGSDGQTFREAVDDALDALRLAVEVRAGCLVVVSGAQAGHIFSHARRLLCDALRKLGDAAGHYDLAIALQPMHRLPVERWSMLNSLDAALDAVNQCNHPRVGLVFDAYHLWQEPDLCERIPDVVPWIKLATLSDARSCSNPEPRSNAQTGEGCSFAPADEERCLPGQGVLPLSQIITALEAGGYRGAYDVQLTGDRCWRSDYRSLLADCRAALLNIAPELFGGGDMPRPDGLPTNAAPLNPGPLNPVPVARMP
ncbi:MAG TPA: sugar phosphate isomerase/epimerase family protein [Planctomycetaceae bacterium]